ncbi:MAG: ASKHA domain-containing protein [Bacillota bacterium]|nr:ASKHA domain-containing protein [Bacillota bacterium]
MAKDELRVLQLTVSGHRAESERIAIPAAEAGGRSLADWLVACGIEAVPMPCGGHGRCGKCVVEFWRAGASAAERVLSCQYVLDPECDQGARVFVPGEAAMTIPLEFAELDLTGTPPVGIGRYCVAVDIGTTTVVALLLDLGSSSGSAAELSAASDRHILAGARAPNCQRFAGADVISRIQYAREHGLDSLVLPLRALLAELAGELVVSAKAVHGLSLVPESIDAWAVAGNTIMLHFLAGLDPSSIGEAPFEPLSRFGESWTAAELGLPGRVDGPVWLLPAISGYVGGDVVGGLVAAGVDRSRELELFIDIGTNGEMALGSATGLICCSTAAGPAFEGATIEMGLPGVSGAVDRVTVAAVTAAATGSAEAAAAVVTGSSEAADWPFVVRTINDAEATGICGSGLLDAMASLLDLGLVDETGRFADPEDLPPHLAACLLPRRELGGRAAVASAAATGNERPDELVCLLQRAPDIYLSGRDIREIQLAKAAIAAGISTLLDADGRVPQDVRRLGLAGGFGSVVRAASVARIGLIPAALEDRVEALGNTSLQGAVRALVDASARERMLAVAHSADYIELSANADFMERYVDSMFFDN